MIKTSTRMRLVLVAFTVLLFQVSVLAQDKARQIDELVSVYNKYGQFNGSALVAEHGNVILKKGYGLANMEWNIPNEPDTKFRLGSITKQFTATLILQLAEQGKLKLDGKVSDYLDSYRKDTGGKVTIHNLLSHTSGIPNYTASQGFFQNVSRNPYGVADFIKQYASGDLEFEPGTKFNYSNSGYFLLGAIIEKVTGKPYEQVLKENIFDPVGMKNTGYDHYDQIISKRATGYIKTPKGYQNARYLDKMVEGITNILYGQPFEPAKRSIAEALRTTVVEKDAAAAIKQYRELKTTKSNEYDFSEAELNTLGYQLLQLGKNHEAIEIFKLNVEAYPQAFNTYDSLGEAYMVHKEKELAIANYKKSLELNPKNAGAVRALAALTTVESKEPKVASKIYESYAGDYELAPNFILTITSEDGKVMAQVTGQPKVEIYPSADTEFFYKVVDAQITFVKNGEGKVMQLILHQNGRNMEAKRIR